MPDPTTIPASREEIALYLLVDPQDVDPDFLERRLEMEREFIATHPAAVGALRQADRVQVLIAAAREQGRSEGLEEKAGPIVEAIELIVKIIDSTEGVYHKDGGKIRWAKMGRIEKLKEALRKAQGRDGT